MAKVSVVRAPQEAYKAPEIEKVVLELTAQEAQVLRDVIGAIARQFPQRATVGGLYDALCRAGFSRSRHHYTQ